MNVREDTLDTKTGIVYASRMAAGDAVANEFKLESLPGRMLVWYDVLRLAKLYRFVDIGTCRCVRKDGSLGAKYIGTKMSGGPTAHLRRR